MVTDLLEEAVTPETRVVTGVPRESENQEGSISGVSHDFRLRESPSVGVDRGSQAVFGHRGTVTARSAWGLISTV